MLKKQDLCRAAVVKLHNNTSQLPFLNLYIVKHFSLSIHK